MKNRIRTLWAEVSAALLVVLLLIGGALDWIADGMRYDIRQHVRRLCLLFDGTVEEALHRSADMPNTSADAAT